MQVATLIAVVVATVVIVRAVDAAAKRVVSVVDVGGVAMAGQLDDVRAAVESAKTAVQADLERVIAHVESLKISQSEKDSLIAEIGAFGTAFDGVGAAVETVPDVPVEEVPTDGTVEGGTDFSR